ncbi:MAG: chromosomal replication initiator protein DnaA [Cardiobacteriaceae bacterium]|nr:chromosomal replication initiator protein DnaA [Cardiobacteriaceae bacterium]
MTPEELWSLTLDKLSTIISREDTMLMLRSLEIYVNGDEIILNAPNKFARDHIQKNHWDLVVSVMKTLLEREDNKVIRLEYLPQPDIFATSPAKTKRREEPEVIEPPFVTHLKPEHQFGNFVSGPSNDNAFAAAQAVACGFNDIMNPLLIYGGTGLGKSHLMHAIGNAMVARGLKRVRFIHAEDFVNEMVNSINNKTTPQFMESFRHLDALLIDDVQFLGGKERSQAQFFYAFNSLFDQKRQIIMTCDRYPKEIEGLEDRLRSRFGQGLAVTVAPPEFETRVAILNTKAEKIGFSLPPDVAFFIAENIASNVRELEGALRKVYVKSAFHQAEPTIAVVREALADQIHAQNKRVNVDNIQKVSARFYDVALSDLLAKQRGKANIALARQVAMCLTKELTRLSYPQVGELFGGRDHSTVMHACKNVQKRIGQDRQFADEYTALKMSITG